MPSNPVCYNTMTNLRCTVKEQLNPTPVWQLKRANSEYEIHNGTESDVTVGPKGTNVTIEHITGPWEGTLVLATVFTFNIFSMRVARQWACK